MHLSLARGAAAGAAILILLVVLAAGASGQCVDGCPIAGDVSEAEPCLIDEAQDSTNGGCDSLPHVFTHAVPGTIYCGMISTYDVGPTDRRDTDWYRLSPGALIAADADGDGIVNVRARLFSEFPGFVAIYQLGAPLCSDPAAVGVLGHGVPFCSGWRYAQYGAVIADHPYGLAVFVSSGNPDGSAILNGYECSSTQNQYTLFIHAFDQPGDEIATGPDPLADGYLRVTPDAYGSWVAESFGGRGDLFNPAGPAQAQPVAFTAGTYLFVTGGGRELLTEYPNWDGVEIGSFHLDQTLDRMVFFGGSEASDSDGDLVDDTLTSTFRVFGGAVNIIVHLTQRVQSVATGVSSLTQTYHIENNGSATLNATLVRVLDADLVWSGDFTDDSVGTLTNDAATDDRHVFIREAGDPATEVRLIIPSGGDYFGGKHGVVPGAPPAFGFGTGTEVWSAQGIPTSWRNHIAGVGSDSDGESGAAPGGCTSPCDGFVGMEIPINGLQVGGQAIVMVQHVFGAAPFSGPQEFLAAGEAIRDATGDFDGDSTSDVIAVLPPAPLAGAGPLDPGRVQVFLNQGNAGPVWLGLSANPPVQVGTEPSSVAVGQLNSLIDSALDAVVSNRGDDTISVLINSGLGDGTFLPQVIHSVGAAPSAVGVGEFTEDGLADLIVANEDDDTLTLLVGDGLGGFIAQAVAPPIPVVGSGPRALVTDDLDNDKCDDVAVVSRFIRLAAGPPVPGVLFILKSNGNGTFQPPVAFEIGVEPSDIASGDLDANGSRDLVATNFADSTASFLTNQGTIGQPDFDPPVDVPVGGNPVAIKTVDFDVDDDDDLAVVADDADLDATVVQLLLNTFNGRPPGFAAPIGLSVDASPNFVAVADFNADGLPDLVTANTDDGATGGSVTVLLNQLPVETAACPGDFDDDQTVGIADLLSLLSAWGFCGSCPQDLDDDGQVAIFDLLILLAAWGACP